MTERTADEQESIDLARDTLVTGHEVAGQLFAILAHNGVAPRYRVSAGLYVAVTAACAHRTPGKGPEDTKRMIETMLQVILAQVEANLARISAERQTNKDFN